MNAKARKLFMSVDFIRLLFDNATWTVNLRCEGICIN
jgi:hypothetical protein